MPRLRNGDEFVPGPAVPDGCKPSDEVFVVRASGEGVKTYEEFLSKTHLYRRREWQNAVTGKGSFTYEEALRDEEKTLATLAKVRAGGFGLVTALYVVSMQAVGGGWGRLGGATGRRARRRASRPKTPFLPPHPEPLRTP